MARVVSVRKGVAFLLSSCFIALILSFARPFAPASAGVRLDGYADNGNAYQYVLLGRYPQSYAGGAPPAGVSGADWVRIGGSYFRIDPIVWRVLSADRAGGARKALLLSEKNLDAVEFYPESYKGGAAYVNNYANSHVRDFLVSDDTAGFYTGSYFKPAERRAISADSFETKDGLGSGATTTTNPFFLLSREQLTERAFGFAAADIVEDANRVGENTGYVAAKRAALVADEPGVWWSRSPFANNSHGVYCVRKNGWVVDYTVNPIKYAVRPAFFLDLESAIFKSASSDVFGRVGPLGSNGPAGGSISDPYCLFFGADLLEGASVSGDLLSMNFKCNIGKIRDWPAPDDFIVTSGSGLVPVLSVASSDSAPRALLLKLESPVEYGNVVNFSYVLGVDAESGNLTTGAISSGDALPGAYVQRGFVRKPVANLTPNPNSGPNPDIDIEPSPTERECLSSVASECGVSCSKNANGATFVDILIPFAANLDPAAIESLEAEISGIGFVDVSCRYVDEDGSEFEIPRKNAAARGALSAPHIRISFETEDADPLGSGVLVKIFYTLKNDATPGGYVQTFPDGGLKLSAIPRTDAAQGAAQRHGSGGCGTGSAGAAGFIAAPSFAGLACRRKKG